MMQFAMLLNELREAGTDCFTRFLSKASSSEASQAGSWMNSATPAQVKTAAALLNEDKLDEFRALIGVGSARRPAPAAETGGTRPERKKPWWKFWG
jgi:hypothetical protein